MRRTCARHSTFTSLCSSWPAAGIAQEGGHARHTFPSTEPPSTPPLQLPRERASQTTPSWSTAVNPPKAVQIAASARFVYVSPSSRLAHRRLLPKASTRLGPLHSPLSTIRRSQPPWPRKLTDLGCSATSESLAAASARSASRNALATGIWWISCSEMRVYTLSKRPMLNARGASRLRTSLRHPLPNPLLRRRI